MIKAADTKAGTILERDGLKRELLKIIPGNKYASPAVQWRRPGNDFVTKFCSVSAWDKWAEGACLVSAEGTVNA